MTISTVTNIDADLTPGFIEGIQTEYNKERPFMQFNRAHFTTQWDTLIKANIGAVWVLKDGNETVGASGGIISPEPIDGASVASLGFWYVRKAFQGGFDSTRLLLAFEMWAATHKAQRCVAACCYDTMGGVQDKYLQIRGYKPYETRYYKELTSWASANP